MTTTQTLHQTAPLFETLPPMRKNTDGKDIANRRHIENILRHLKTGQPRHKIEQNTDNQLVLHKDYPIGANHYTTLIQIGGPRYYLEIVAHAHTNQPYTNLKNKQNNTVCDLLFNTARAKKTRQPLTTTINSNLYTARCDVCRGNIATIKHHLVPAEDSGYTQQQLDMQLLQAVSERTDIPFDAGLTDPASSNATGYETWADNLVFAHQEFMQNKIVKTVRNSMKPNGGMFEMPQETVTVPFAFKTGLSVEAETFIGLFSPSNATINNNNDNSSSMDGLRGNKWLNNF